MKTAKELSKFVYQSTGEKIHWYLGSCCYDITSVWSMEEVASPEFSTNLADCDILVVGTKLAQSDLIKIQEAISTRERKLVAFGNCSISGGIFHQVSQVSSLADNFKIDLAIPGCPPTFEQFKTSLCHFLKIGDRA